MNIPPLVPRRVSIARAFRFLKNPIPLITQNLNEYGKTYAFHIGGSKLAIMTAEPAVIKHVLQKNNKNLTYLNLSDSESDVKDQKELADLGLNELVHLF